MSRRETLLKMLEKEPGDAFLNYALAMEHLKGSSPDEALEQFDRVLAIDPDYIGAYQQKSQLLMKHGRTVEARACLDRGIRAASTKGDLHAAEELRGLLAELT